MGMKIEQNMGFLMHSLRKIESGMLGPAPMQRDYAWDRQNVLDFCGSLLDGLPIGSLTIWRPKDEDAVRPKLSRIGPISSPGAVNMILDGHNRLATTAWISHDMSTIPSDLSGNEADVWGSGDVLCLDYVNGTAIFLPEADAESPGFIPANIGFRQSRGLLDWMRRNDRLSEAETTKALNFADRFSRALREQRIVTTHINDASPDEAKSVFLRVCKTGVPMSAEDFDRALNWEPDASPDM